MADAMALTLLFIIIAVGGKREIIMAGAQSPPSPISSSLSCGTSLANLVACLGYLQGGSRNSSPTQGCCTALASEVDSSSVCVCQLLTTGNNPVGIPINNIPVSIPINQNRGLALPGACKISTPTLSQCMSAAVGAGAPVATPVSSPLPATSSPSPAATSTTQSPATSVYPSALPRATSGVVLSPSGSHKGPTPSSNAGLMTITSFSMNSLLIVGLAGIIAATIIV